MHLYSKNCDYFDNKNVENKHLYYLDTENALDLDLAILNLMIDLTVIER